MILARGIKKMYVDYKKVGKRIAARRKELGLKQWQVTEMADLSDKYISNIERATSVMSVDVLMKLCDVLQTTPDYILLGTTQKHTPAAYERHVLQSFSMMTPKQMQLVLNFVDWICTQELE